MGRGRAKLTYRWRRRCEPRRAGLVHVAWLTRDEVAFALPGLTVTVKSRVCPGASVGSGRAKQTSRRRRRSEPRSAGLEHAAWRG